MHASERVLIIVTGPVGAGKSTTALALAQALRGPTCAVAAIDLDQMYGFVRQKAGFGELTAWARARCGAAALANCLFDTGMAVVIVDGEFFNAEELATLRVAIDAGVRHYFFTLRIGYATALDRVQGDPSRGASKDPIFLKSLHNDFVQSLPFLEAQSMVITTDHLTLDQVVAHMIAVVSSTSLPTTSSAMGTNTRLDR